LQLGVDFAESRKRGTWGVEVFVVIFILGL
jgi:hypothetical protein